MHKSALTFALAGFLYAATGLALAHHLCECEHRADHHDPQNCVHFYTIHAGVGAELATPITPPERLDGPPVIRALDAEPTFVKRRRESVSPRGPPALLPTL